MSVDLLDWPSWTRDAACRGWATDAFFDLAETETVHRVKDLCGTCPVRDECLQFGLDAERHTPNLNLRHGIFGGLTPRERLAHDHATGAIQRQRHS